MLKSLHFPGQQSVCKVCGGPAVLYGAVDFNKCCLNPVNFPILGIPVHYHHCAGCGLVFSNAFDRWSVEDFHAHIYNDDYVSFDPESVYVRPRACAKLVMDMTKRGGSLRMLDYGGGMGLMASLLREQGLQADSWDPMVDEDAPPERNVYDLVTAFEVFEHTPTPRDTVEQVLNCLAPNGVVLLSTAVADDRPPGDVGYWYIAPRNGHITIHTRASLQKLFALFGYRVRHLGDQLHLAYKNLPHWLTLDPPRSSVGDGNHESAVADVSRIRWWIL